MTPQLCCIFLFNDIDKSAETDQHLFWNLLNRHKGRKNRVCELITGETINREPRAIAQAWADYFSDLYTPPPQKKNLDRFDDEHKLFVENSLQDMAKCSYSNNKQILDDDIALHEVLEAIKSLKRKKSCGLDLGRLSIYAVLGRTAGLKNGARKPHTIL